MILRPVHPAAGEAIPVGEPETRERLRELYRRDDGAPGIRLNLVASVDGSARGDDGTSETLSSRADRAVLGAIRAESDVVLVGAATLRAEGYLLPRTARLAVVTASGDLSGASTGGATDADRLLVLGPGSAGARVAETLPTPHTFVELPAGTDGRVDLAVALDALAEVGAPRIVCEGGPALAAELIAAGLVGEVCLSTSPRLVGGGLPVLGGVPHPAIDLELASLLVDDAGGLYARWLVPSAR
ncbi:dihydrofolate reductase family protein [Protaetiibacter sp. SSC-01]|uniref:dihydrofolate reductase family protein n=1 Tax=Protaetiibacter sp. SSC-01 TaxID=2759943 RepID=UPI001657290D|nr:dihydrofolate reductase family protein [Protaetiibacter sp. SSC-01]QNO36426.1 dihydrofolate reductase family protein [Protaetiibacter sp. SSC-01]